MLDNFSKTAFKTEDGKILSLWHWTNQIFSKFEYGDIGFHAGIFDAAHAIMFDKDVKGNTSVFKKLYFNSENPLFIERDLGTSWTPHLVAILSNVLNANEEAEIYSLDGSTRQQYDSPASIRLREMLRNKGYDSIIYINAWEGGVSVIAFDSDQFYTVAENGAEINFETDDSSYSYTPPKSETFDELLSQHKRGLITDEEFKEGLFPQKPTDPLSLINTKPEDFGTTPDVKKKTGTFDGDGTRDTIIAKGRSTIFNTAFKNDVASDDYIQKYMTITNKQTWTEAARELDECA